MYPSLNVAQDIRVKFLEKSAKHYLNKSTILFGASNSGKSTILIEILFLLKEHVPIIFVFAPTAESNNAFDGIVPNPLIYKTVEIDILKDIYERQQAATKIYNSVNKLTSLRVLFERIASHTHIETAKMVYANARNLINKKTEESNTGHIEKKMSILNLKSMRDEYLIKLYKSVIRLNKKRLLNMDITDKDRYIIKYLDFNPNCVVVFDDCGAILKKFQKEEVVKKIIFQGRHSHINLILTLQDDINLDSAIKKNAFVNIFTTGRCASAYFERGSNNFNKKEKDRASRIINYVFSASKKDYKKIVYLRDDVDPFRYTIAELHNNFKFGCESIWKLCQKIDREQITCDFDNDPLLSAFRIDI
jgi:hypothetical protein